jgi:PIN domain nuclease of toxin-antitoxin system
MTTLLLDTHVVHWWSAEPGRSSRAASTAIESADVLAVAAITGFELAWLAVDGRIVITVPLRSWLDRLADHLQTIPIDPAIAAAAVALPPSFPGDPADRLIYATALELAAAG